MRRLLAFGTGAAIIGLALLLVAFFESYVIVGELQKEIANQTSSTVNTILEDATLEAVFLGVMVALGYGLISQGLNGIRRQEMLELEREEENQTVKAEVMAKITRDRARDTARRREVRHVITSKSSQPEALEESGQIESPKIIAPARQEEPIPSSLESASVPSIRMQEESNPMAESSSMSEPATAAEPAPIQYPVIPASMVPERTTTVPETSVSQEQDVKTPISSPEVQGGQMDTSRSETTTALSQPPVVWESGPPPALEGIDVLPERPEIQPEMATVPPNGTTASSETTAFLQPAKRGRGRPKGSKSKRRLATDATETSEGTESS